MKQRDRFLRSPTRPCLSAFCCSRWCWLAFVLRVQRRQLRFTRRRRLFPDRAGRQSVHARRHGRRVSSLRLLYLCCCGGAKAWRACCPRPTRSDQLTYKTICVAFPLLTLMIAVGAYWANHTWGSYWSWDPKETWAAITWLVYAGYLHMRITRGWRGRRAAYFAILGFGVVIFTFLGVTYLLPGLHAYA